MFLKIKLFIQKIVAKIKEIKNRKALEELSLKNLMIRVDEFLIRIKGKMPDFVTIGGGLLGYKKWLSEPFLVLDYHPYIPVADSSERGALHAVYNILKEVSTYEGNNNEQ